MAEAAAVDVEKPLGNAFSEEYLEWLLERSEPYLSAESEGAGPWELRRHEDAFPLFRA